ncbi:MAG: MarR family transcriptional regulator [Spirochaetia bacterium]|jgi:DNA-binding MarR family transcriptional regulator|nr:MarR family transcriptional regulator [Spirochaetia bacterium]
MLEGISIDYIETTLGMKTSYQQWPHESELPYYLRDRYEFSQATIGNIKTIFVYPKMNLDQMGSVKKQISRIQKIEPLPVVFVLKSIDRNRRTYMISAKIPFIVPNNQIYLPFMGIVLQDRFKTEKIPMIRLQPSTQVLFFHFLYQKQNLIYLNDVAHMLGYSAMTISRAASQLEQTGLFGTQKDGLRKILISRYNGQQLFRKMLPYLISPVHKTIFIEKKNNLSKLYSAGISALSGKSMLNPPAVKCYATRKEQNWEKTNILMDADIQVQVELWKYDPGILGKNGIVDTLSLAMALKDNQDERVKEALDKTLNQIWEN